MGEINVLSFEVANLIAAGEVVDRPGSAIKELIENAIDAGASRVTVEIQHGGVRFMRVTDNGKGMLPEDLPVAVRRHATSKIRDAKDLNAILTLGFRGEALAAIAAVSDLRIITKTKDAQLGAAIEVHTGRAGVVTEQGAADGTTVIVENLFANVPARLKFLKQDLTEAKYVAAIVEKVALSHPEIAFKFISDGNMKLNTSGDGALTGVIRAVYGKEFAAKLLPVRGESNGVKAEGFITAPDVPRGNRNFQNFFINGRYVKSRTVQAAVEQAYTSYIPPEKFPGCVIKLEISPAFVDVNVHPSKLEVKFSDERPVFDAVYHAVRDALLSNTLRPGEESPVRDFRASAGLSGRPAVSGAFVPVKDRQNGDAKPEQLSFNDLGKVTPAAPVAGSERGQYRAPVVTGLGAYQRQNAPVYGGYRIPGNGNGTPAAQPRTGSNDVPEKKEGVPERDFSTVPAAPGNVPEAPVKPAAEAEKHETRQTVQPAASAQPETPGKEIPAGVSSGEAPVIADYRIIGELFNAYIIVEFADKVTFFDKHAAHERLNFEKMKQRLRSAEHALTYLAVPLDLSLGGEETAALSAHRAEIEKLGFAFAEGENGIRLSGIPMDLPLEEASALMEHFADALAHGTGNVEVLGDTAFEKALYQASCKASIKAGRVYPAGYNEILVRELMAHPEITYCPHGRPIGFSMSKNEFDHNYKRI